MAKEESYGNSNSMMQPLYSPLVATFDSGEMMDRVEIGEHEYE
jgi:hypothetical protein